MKLPSWSALPDIGLYMDQVMTLMERLFCGMPGMGGMMAAVPGGMGGAPSGGPGGERPGGRGGN